MSSAVKLHVTGLRCGGCAAEVQASLAALPGAETSSVSFATSTAHITFHDLTVQEIIAHFAAKGLQAEVIGLDERIAESNDFHRNNLPQHPGATTFDEVELSGLSELLSRPPIGGGSCGGSGGGNESGNRRDLLPPQLLTLPRKLKSSTILTHRPTSPGPVMSVPLHIAVHFASSRECAASIARFKQLQQGRPLRSGGEAFRGVSTYIRLTKTSCSYSTVYHPHRTHPVNIVTSLKTALAIPMRLRYTQNCRSEVEAKCELSHAASRFALCLVPAVYCFLYGMSRWSLRIQSLKWSTTVAAAAAFGVWSYGGWSTHVAAVRGVKSGVWTMDLLICISSSITLWYSLLAAALALDSPVYFESCTGVLGAVLFGRTVEAGVKHAVIKRLRSFHAGNGGATYEVVARTMPITLPSNDFSAVPAALLGVGDIIRFHSDDCLPVDAILQPGSRPVRVDEAVTTGEARPVWKLPGETLLAGSRLLDPEALAEVVGTGPNSFLGKIYQAVDGAADPARTAQGAAAVNLTNRIAAPFISIVLSIALVTLVAWAALVFSGLVVPLNSRSSILHSVGIDDKVTSGSGLLFVDTLQDDGILRNPSTWRGKLLRSCLFIMQFPIAVISVACPCALGLATPIATAAAVAAAAQCGIIIQRFDAVYAVAGKRGIKHLVWDKTGTLTIGEMSVSSITALPEEAWMSPQLLNLNLQLPTSTLCTPPQWKALLLAAAASKNSPHPVARAIVNFCRENAPGQKMPNCLTFQEFPGEGTVAELDGGLPVVVGSAAFCRRLAAGGMQTTTQTSIGVCGMVVAELRLSDEPRADAAATVAALQRSGVVEQQWLCSGDVEAIARQVAQSVGLDETRVRAGVKPEEKLEFIRSLKEETATKGGQSDYRIKNQVNEEGLLCLKETTCYSQNNIVLVGDGANDVPAMTEAAIAIALPSRLSHVVFSAADVILMRAKLTAIPQFFSIARHCCTVIRFNILWACGFNLLVLPVAAGVLYPTVMLPPALAGLLMTSSSVIVVAASATLLLHKD